MTISIDFATRVITVPKADMLLVQSTPIEIRELDLNEFRLVLKDLEDSEDGMAFVDTHRHNPPVSVGGVQLARVVEIINEYTVTFENGTYAVNLAGANSNVSDRLNLNSVSVRSANSAGLVQTRDIEQTAFLGVVAIDTINGSAGTTFPRGTLRQPVNNVADAVLIAFARGLPRFLIMEDITLSGVDVSGYNFVGVGRHVVLTLGSGLTTIGCQFEGVTLTGTVPNAATHVRRCLVSALTYPGGYIEGCALVGTLALTGGGSIVLEQCIDADSSGIVPTLDLSGLSPGAQVAVRGVRGGIKIANCAAAVDVAINIEGRVLFENVTAGDFIVRGIGHVEGTVGGTATLDDADLVTKEIGVTVQDKDDIRDRILADSTPFLGGYVDAAISSRSSHADPDPMGRLDAPISSRAAPSDILSDATPFAGSKVTEQRPRRGVAVSALPFVMFRSSDRSPSAGLTVTGVISLDGGATVPLTNGINALGSGVYSVALTAGEMAADVVVLIFTAPGAEPTIITLVLAL